MGDVEEGESVCFLIHSKDSMHKYLFLEFTNQEVED